MALELPLFLQGASYSSRLLRQLLANVYTEGILGPTSFAVTQRAAGATMSVDIAVGQGVVTGDDQANQGAYLAINTATYNLTIPAAPGSNSRYDGIFLRINDPTAGGPAGNTATFAVVSGTAAASPVAPSTPASAIRLANVLVSSGTASITNGLITDARTIATFVHDAVDDLQASRVGTAAATANALMRRDGSGRVAVATPAAPGDAATAGYVASLIASEISTAVSSTWTAPGYDVGWAAAGGSTRALAYKKIGNVMYLVGTAVRSSGSLSHLGSVPAGFRPSADVRALAEGTSPPLTVKVDSNGDITVFGATNGTNVSFNMVIPIG